MKIDRRGFIQLTAAGALFPKSLLAAVPDGEYVVHENNAINGWRFREIDVSHLRVFGKSEPIRFGDGITVIEGMNGGGKTTIFNALNGVFPGVDAVTYGKRDPTIPDWLTFVGERMYFDPWHPSRSLALLFRRKEFTGKLDLLSREIEASFDDLMRYTWKPPIHIKISDDDMGVINISRYDLAAGEKMALHLAIIQAVRKVGGPAFDVPLVFDSALGAFDGSIMKQIPHYLKTTASQVIVLGTQSCLSWTGHDLPDYKIVRDEANHQHYVI